jgi:putative ABC transport system permease protein
MIIESAFVALLGGVLGVLLALPVNFISTGTVNWQTFSEVAFNFRVDQVVASIGILLAVISGVIGGLIPAVSAARLPITRALREI